MSRRWQCGRRLLFQKHQKTQVLGQLIKSARAQTRSLALTLDRVGELVYTAGASGDGIGGRGYLAVRFRLDFLAALRRTHASNMIRRPVSRWAEARRHDKTTVREFMDPTVVVPKKLLAAPGFSRAHEKRETLEGHNILRTIKERLTSEQRCGPIGLHTFVKQLSSIDDSGDGVYDPTSGNGMAFQRTAPAESQRCNSDGRETGRASAGTTRRSCGGACGSSGFP